MKLGDVIRVEGWPGTHGSRYVIIEELETPSGPAVRAREVRGKITELTQRVFPRNLCHIDRKASRVRAEV